MLWMLARIRVAATMELSQRACGRVQGGEKLVSFLLFREFLFQHPRYRWKALAQRLFLCIFSDGACCTDGKVTIMFGVRKPG